jgi:phage tail sheath gpL-like
MNHAAAAKPLIATPTPTGWVRLVVGGRSVSIRAEPGESMESLVERTLAAFAARGDR